MTRVNKNSINLEPYYFPIEGVILGGVDTIAFVNKHAGTKNGRMFTIDISTVLKDAPAQFGNVLRYTNKGETFQVISEKYSHYEIDYSLPVKNASVQFGVMNTKTDDKGNFSFAVHDSLFNKSKTWDLTINAKGYLSKSIKNCV